MRTVCVVMLTSGSLIALTACGLVTSSSGLTPDYKPETLMCEVFVPIMWSRKDTDETIKAVKIHNAVWLSTCGPIIRPPQQSMGPP